MWPAWHPMLGLYAVIVLDDMYEATLTPYFNPVAL